MKKIVLLISILFLAINTNAQSISGKITDKNGETLAGALIQLGDSYQVKFSDADGKFSFNKLKPGNYKLIVSFVGYENLVKEIELQNDVNLEIELVESNNLTEEVIVGALRAGRNTPVAASEINKETLEKSNLGQDMPFLLEMMPSVTSTSDAGAGVGYSKLSIRGTDLSRINVTVNGIPLNDAESHGVWWVDLPDLAASVENIEIQRGVGTSTNGTSAFGANINVQTNQLKKDAYSRLAASYGTFNTYKTSINAGTGLINDHFTFDVRLSKIHSDGFINRANPTCKAFLPRQDILIKKH